MDNYSPSNVGHALPDAVSSKHTRVNIDHESEWSHVARCEHKDCNFSSRHQQHMTAYQVARYHADSHHQEG